MLSFRVQNRVHDTRSFQRVKLSDPIDARIGTALVSVVDVSGTGLQVHHQDALPPRNDRCTIRFQWDASRIRLECVVIWTAIQRLPRSTSEKTTFRTGLRIDSTDDAALRAFQEMVSHFRDAISDESPRGPEFFFCELVAGAWKQTRTSKRDQPGDGFTVSANEDTTQIERLCAAYATGDAETRKLIRTLAALSLNKES